MSEIHPSAYIDKRAQLGRDVTVGPFCYIGPEVVLGDDCFLHAQVTLQGPLQAGRNNQFFPQSVVGTAPQDLKYRNGPTRVTLGDDNVIREMVTIHRGTEVDRVSAGETRIGNGCLLMAGCHIAHDCEVGNHVIISNYAQIAGHCKLEDHSSVGALVGMAHFVTVGRYAYITAMTRVARDVPPYCIAHGHEMKLRALNHEGLKRWGFATEQVDALDLAFRKLFRPRSEPAATNTLATLEELAGSELIRDPHVQYLVEFVRRQLTEGKHGRTREATRTDTPADRSNFYSAKMQPAAR